MQVNMELRLTDERVMEVNDELPKTNMYHWFKGVQFCCVTLLPPLHSLSLYLTCCGLLLHPPPPLFFLVSFWYRDCSSWKVRVLMRRWRMCGTLVWILCALQIFNACVTTSERTKEKGRGERKEQEEGWEEGQKQGYIGAYHIAENIGSL